MVSHADEYQKYLEERKSKLKVYKLLVETCGLHLKEGEEPSESDLKLNSLDEIQDSQALSNF